VVGYGVSEPYYAAWERRSYQMPDWWRGDEALRGGVDTSDRPGTTDAAEERRR